MECTLHFPPYLNPIPPTEELLAKWKADYENVRTSMILEPDSEIRFETILSKVRELLTGLTEPHHPKLRCSGNERTTIPNNRTSVS